ncbi:MAG TPA: hypothetical protein VEA39_02630 [Methylophilaceae bacterium]|nr:hypothetical protein [Methylophilaceae bacterium]
MKKLYQHILSLSLVLLTSIPAQAADVVLVVAANSPVVSLDRQEVEDIFLGKMTSLTRIGKVTPLDRSEENLRQQFYETYTNKTLSQVKAHWARIIFTGRGYPPKAVNLDDLKRTLRSNPSAIGYMSADQVDDTLRTIKLNEK